jgi:hypothetical protein
MFDFHVGDDRCSQSTRQRFLFLTVVLSVAMMIVLCGLFTWRSQDVRLTAGKTSGSSLLTSRSRRRGTSVVFIGDSVTRYQYLSFVFHLAFGRFPGDDEENWAEEKKWASWTEFYNGTNSLLNSSPFSEEICDCYRKEDTGLEEIIENRMFRSQHHDTLSVYYFQFFRIGNPMKGHSTFLSQDDSGCVPGNCSTEPLWEHSLVDALHHIIKPLNPEVVVVNAGLHESTNTWDQDVIDSFLEAMDGFPVPVWKTTTARDGERSRPDTDFKMLANILLQKRRIRVFDAFQLSERDIYREKWDNVHFHSVTYKMLNEELNEFLRERRGVD